MDIQNDLPLITVVSGLPRSGTSMMMKILEAGGKILLTDNVRKADDFNPRGYYEFEAVKSLPKGQIDWLPMAIDKVVKIIAPLLHHLPSTYQYKIIFMTRTMDEILLSQRKMVSTLGKTENFSDDEMLKKIFNDQLLKIHGWLDSQQNINYINMDYHGLIVSPSDHLTKLLNWMGESLDIVSMLKVIDPNLYRSKF